MSAATRERRIKIHQFKVEPLNLGEPTMVGHPSPYKVVIEPDDKELAKARRFAKAVIDTNITCYRLRSQNDERIITEQITNGKIAEIAVARLLQERSQLVRGVDFAVYEARAKSYSADLIAQNPSDGLQYEVGVKSITADAALRYGISWTFQYGTGGTDKVVFGTPGKCPDTEKTSVIVFTGINYRALSKAYMVSILGFVTVSALHKANLWQPPFLARLANSKRVLYYADLLEKFPEQL